MKKKRHSKTHWASLAIAILGIIEIILGVVEAKFSLIQNLFGEYWGVSLLLISVVMSVLRQYTKEPIEPIIKRKPDA